MRVIRGLMIAAAPLLWTDVLVLSQNCTAEMAACEDDITCATCFNNATTDGSCDRNATDCAGMADYYCCVAGDACSNNTLLVDHINCKIEVESCTVTDVCNYASPTPSPPDSNGESSSHTYPWLFRAGIFVGVTAMLWTQQLY